MNEASVQKFVLDILRVAGANLEEVANHAYRTQVPPELARFFPGKQSLHFTFDEEYFDLHLESGVEYVAPGYPLLDRLIAYSRTRFLVSEGLLEGKPLPTVGLQSQSLILDLQTTDNTKTLIGFHFKATFRSDEYSEEFIQVWVDPREKVILTNPPGRRSWRRAERPRPVAKSELQACWNLVEGDLKSILSERIARYEETANIRLSAEFQRLRNAGATQTDLARAAERYGLKVQPELIFAEVVHYPLQDWHVSFMGAGWREKRDYTWDAVEARWVDAPRCPVCKQQTFSFEACDEGRHAVCSDCSGQCSTCERKQCADHPTSPCRVCGKGSCNTCLSQCNECGNASCPECRQECPDCQADTCLDCYRACGVCHHRACGKHFAQCHVTGEWLCETHAVRCAGCKKTTHPSRLLAVQGRDGGFCPNCIVPCSESHPSPLYLAKQDAKTCAGTHQRPHALCQDHQHPCALHGGASVFCHAHTEACHMCRRGVCGDHRKRSYLSGHTFCNEHAQSCPRCRRWVGSDEVVTTNTGEALCRACAMPCHHCDSTESPWSLDALHPCPTCLKEGLSSHTVRPQPSPDDLKRSHPHIVYCRNHLHNCHICKRQHCRDHLSACPECNGPTCKEDWAVTASGRRVCLSCAVPCAHCPEGTFYLKVDVSACQICGTNTCETHSRNCESCLHSTCEEHAAACGLCGGTCCSNCCDSGLCRTCRGLARSEVSVLDEVPLPRPAQRWIAVSARTERPDKTERLHILYYEEFESVWQFFRAFGARPAAILAVFDVREGSTEHVRTVEVERKPLPILPYDPSSYLQARFRRAKT